MRILVGSFSHESNTFNPNPTTLESFDAAYGQHLELLITQGGRSAFHGVASVLQKHGVDLVYSAAARATPGGPVARKAYDAIKERILEAAAGPLDGVCLHLHGSMTVEDLDDAEGDLLQAVRETVGPDIPIVCSLDMHAMVSAAMLRHAEAFVGYRTAPHMDAYETGRRAAELLLRSLQERFALTTAAVALPLLVSGEQSETSKPPMQQLIPLLIQTDRQPDILASSYFLGFPWADVPMSAASALVVTRDDQALAETTAKGLAQVFWQHLEQFQFTTPAYPFPEALRQAQAMDSGPVCIADCGDNPGAGGSQNIVAPLEHLLAEGVPDVLFGAVADPQAWAFCEQAGCGSSVQLEVGRATIAPESSGLQLDGTVTQLGKLGSTPAAVLRVQETDVVISQRRTMMLDPQDLVHLGLDPASYRILVLKSGYLDPKYEAIATGSLLALTPGYTNQMFTELHYERLPRPMYPLDQGFEYRPTDYVLR